MAIPDILRQHAEGKQAAFIERIPPGTVVYENLDSIHFGTTIGGKRIYFDPKDDYVAVKNVDGVATDWGLWSVDGVRIK